MKADLVVDDQVHSAARASHDGAGHAALDHDEGVVRLLTTSLHALRRLGRP
jgi:hypothetical protein